MILITSGAFISTEFQVELGKLPPALVPIGNKRLYEHQVTSLRTTFPNLDIYLSITDAYSLRTTDEILLKRLNVNVISVPDGLSLGDSLLYVINSIGKYDETLRILHGDTYLSKIPLSENVIALAEAEDDYPWEIESEDATSEKVWCGYFSFSDIKLLARSLSSARGKFVDAVRIYQRSCPQQFTIVDDWLDMGHVNNYFRSRAKITTQRSFNELHIADGVVLKSSFQHQKMEAEANWFASLPYSVKRYAPQLIRNDLDNGRRFYALEYLPYLPLNELYVHGSLPLLFWRRIFNLADTVLNDFQNAEVLTHTQKEKIQYDFTKLVSDKTNFRLSKFVEESNYCLSDPTSLNGKQLPSLEQITIECQGAALELPIRPGISHGDFCFSNILFDSRSNALKVVDPRGINVDGDLTILGDLRYDVAKFIHSLFGLYDHIVAGLFTLHEPTPLNFEFKIHLDDTIAAIQQSFERNNSLLRLTSRQVMPLVILLFISMLPLHRDRPERQRAFLANALRLYVFWKEV
ncbi:hypothetical protein [Noviherbaspirillum sedimenti]|uniref:Capsular biosynthesis protein n=1 Tax=Noviherbaspirillum sedimenti TaxID=2320865 RepID=A0A3A3G0P1_9BURK|nr:hypothetical protein [Noviherbaspirillum sedimenti]RJG02038.1 hypothetical protein D3878_10980 [Noviherbaspirillum sedimenti]